MHRPPGRSRLRYYLCRERTDPLRAAQGQRCTARYIPPGSWTSWSGPICATYSPPRPVARALDRARGGAWLPQELQARQATVGQAQGQLNAIAQQRLELGAVADGIEAFSQTSSSAAHVLGRYRLGRGHGMQPESR